MGYLPGKECLHFAQSAHAARLVLLFIRKLRYAYNSIGGTRVHGG